MKLLGEFEFWFLTGSQDLYGDDTLRQVAVHSGQIATGLNDSASIPVRVVFKPVVKSPEGMAAACLAGPFTWGRDAEHAADNAIARRTR
jgi:L-arabinose isomerase